MTFIKYQFPLMRLTITKKLNLTPVSLRLATSSLLIGLLNKAFAFFLVKAPSIDSSFLVLTLIRTLRNYCWPAVNFILEGLQ